MFMKCIKLGNTRKIGADNEFKKKTGSVGRAMGTIHFREMKSHNGVHYVMRLGYLCSEATPSKQVTPNFMLEVFVSHFKI